MNRIDIKVVYGENLLISSFSSVIFLALPPTCPLFHCSIVGLPTFFPLFHLADEEISEPRVEVHDDDVQQIHD